MDMWTKRDIITQAYSEIGKADYEFDLLPEVLQSALRQLDAMLATWGTQGIRLGYAGGDGKGDIDAESEVPGWAVEALYLNLAVRLAPSFGKTPSPNTQAGAKATYDAIMARLAAPRARAISGYAGSGRGNLPVRPDGMTTGNDGTLDFGATG